MREREREREREKQHFGPLGPFLRPLGHFSSSVAVVLLE